MIYLNAQGLTTNLTKIQILIHNLKPDIVFLTETHLTDEIN